MRRVSKVSRVVFESCGMIHGLNSIGLYRSRSRRRACRSFSFSFEMTGRSGYSIAFKYSCEGRSAAGFTVARCQNTCTASVFFSDVCLKSMLVRWKPKV